MRAMLMEKPKSPLLLVERPIPNIGAHQLLIKVLACGLCRTDIHVLDGELKDPTLPLIPGHQVVGTVQSIGEEVTNFFVGQRVGAPWLGGSCGNCEYCTTFRENLCDHALYTGYQMNGGLAEYCSADARFCFPIPAGYPETQAAPLFCAGLMAYRALLKTGNAEHLGIYGFGSSAHILIQIARSQGRKVYAFTKPADLLAQQYAQQMGAIWAGGSDEAPPHLLDAAIIFAPNGELVPLALRATAKGGTVVCGGVHMSKIPSFPYDILWGERTLCSVANLTRKDAEEFLLLAPTIPIKTEVHTYPLADTNLALDDLRLSRHSGSSVIII